MSDKKVSSFSYNPSSSNMPTTLDVRRLGKMETAICINDFLGVRMLSQFANLRLGNY